VKLTHYLLLALLLLVGWQQFLLARKETAYMAAEYQRATELERHNIESQQLNELLASERVANHQLARTLQDEQQARLDTARALETQVLQAQQMRAELEGLKHADADSKAWADQPVPAGVNRLLQHRYRARQGGDQDRLPGDTAPGQLPAASADPRPAGLPNE